jgi:hypothetical protein
MELRFVPPDLHAIDDITAEVIACAIWEDERPLRGLAGLLDWRLSGRVSRLARTEFIRGEIGQLLCMQGRPRLPFDKVLVVGCGPRETFGDDAFRVAAGALLRTMEGLKIPRAVVELPGRAGDRIAPDRAAEILLEAARDSAAHDAWFLVETPEAQAKITARGRDERRRVRA